MSVFQNVSLMCAAGFLGACSSSFSFTPAVSGSAAAAGGGTYTITQNGVTRALPAPSGTIFGRPIQFWGPVNQYGLLYEDADVIAIAIMDSATIETLAGISGTTSSNVPVSGSAAYVGDFAAVYYRGGGMNVPWFVSGAFTTNVNFSSGSVTGSGIGIFSTSLGVTGTVSGANFNGTATFSAADYTGAATMPMTGGFYGTQTIAGIYQGTAVTGVFWGQ